MFNLKVKQRLNSGLLVKWSVFKLWGKSLVAMHVCLNDPNDFLKVRRMLNMEKVPVDTRLKKKFRKSMEEREDVSQNGKQFWSFFFQYKRCYHEWMCIWGSGCTRVTRQYTMPRLWSNFKPTITFLFSSMFCFRQIWIHATATCSHKWKVHRRVNLSNL